MEHLEKIPNNHYKGTEKITQNTSKNLGTTLTEYQENSLKFFGPNNERRGGHIEHTDGGIFVRGKSKN